MSSADLPITHVTAYEWEPIISPYGSGDGFGSNAFDREGPLKDGVFGKGAQGALHNWAEANHDVIAEKVRSEYSEKQKHLTVILESELARIRADGASSQFVSVEIVLHEIAIRDTLIGLKSSEFARQSELANAFYGSDPLSKTPFDLASQYRPRQLLSAIKAAWSDSYTAAYNSKLLSEGIGLLNNQSAALKLELTTIQARIAAEAEAQRLAAEAAELARLSAAVEAQRVADEQARIAAKVEAQRVAEEQARIAAEIEAQRVADEQARIAGEAKAYKDAVSFLADINKSILAKYGENMSKVALGLQENISGKKVRSYADAMKTFEKVRINPNIKLNVRDTQAIASALQALDRATLADNVTRLGKAFGVVGKIIQLNAVLDKTILGVERGDWKPLGLELESIGLGIGAGALLAVGMALFFPIFAASAAGVVMVAILMAIMAAYLDAQKVDEINTSILKVFT
ncbi:colicin-like pore-forming protein [Pseudomonas sp. LB3P31]